MGWGQDIQDGWMAEMDLNGQDAISAGMDECYERLVYGSLGGEWNLGRRKVGVAVGNEGETWRKEPFQAEKSQRGIKRI